MIRVLQTFFFLEWRPGDLPQYYEARHIRQHLMPMGNNLARRKDIQAESKGEPPNQLGYFYLKRHIALTNFDANINVY